MTASLALNLALWLLFGLAAGIAHFALLRWNAALYVSAAGVPRALAVQALRMAATTALLAFAAWHGAAALLPAAAGVVAARSLVVRMTTVPP